MPQCASTNKQTYIGNRLVHPLFFSLVKHFVIFDLGFLICTIITFVGKLTMGEFRPHFLDICKPDWNDTCSTHRIFDASVLCKGDPAILKEARQSFPSGHASIAAYAACFTLLYLRKRTSRLVSPHAGRFITPITQCIVISWAFFVGLTRVADNHHHMTDVMFGWALGTATAVILCHHFGFLGKRKSGIRL